MYHKLVFPALMCLCLGCLDNGAAQRPAVNPNNPNIHNPNTPTVVVPSSALFATIAEDIDGSRIADTVELSKIVVTLFRDGRLDRAGFDRFTQAFPTAASKQRALTADDAKTLRGL